MNRPCLICGKSDYHILKAVSLSLCKSCGLLQVKELPADTTKFYRDNYYKEHSTFQGRPGRSNESIYQDGRGRGKAIYEYLSSNLPYPVKRVVDLGCGHGGTVAYLNEHGYTALGVDLNTEAVKFAQQQGLDCRIADVTEATLPADLVIMSHVVEHFTNPLDTIKKIKQNYPDTLIYIQVPGLIGMAGKSFDIRRFIDPAHVSYFTLGSLTNLMSMCGYRRVAGNSFIHSLFAPAEQGHITNVYLRTLGYLTQASIRKTLRLRAIGW